MNLIFKIRGHLYTVTYDRFELDLEENLAIFGRGEIVVTRDGSILKDFGETFVGRKYDAEDVLLSAVLAYINGDRTVKFIVVPDEIKALREKFFEPAVEAFGREVPLRYLNNSIEILELMVVSIDGLAAYSNGDSFIIADKDGHVLTDMENFYAEAFDEIIESRRWLYINKVIEEAV